jgi:polyhydroxyalkanoate synthesis regulator phasin
VEHFYSARKIETLILELEFKRQGNIMSEKENKNSPIEGIIKKVVSVGVGAAFMTEESVKKILEDLPLPKDIVTGLVQNAKGAKEDFTNGIREELRNYLTKVDASKIATDILDRYDVEVEAKFKFKKKKEDKE